MLKDEKDPVLFFVIDITREVALIPVCGVTGLDLPPSYKLEPVCAMGL